MRPRAPWRFALGWILLAVVLTVLVIRAVDVLLVVFLAAILAIYLDAIADLLCRACRMPRTLGLTAGVGTLVRVVVLIAPPVSQVRDLLANLPKYLVDLDQTISRLVRSVPMLGRNVASSGTSGILAMTVNDMLNSCAARPSHM